MFVLFYFSLERERDMDNLKQIKNVASDKKDVLEHSVPVGMHKASFPNADFHSSSLTLLVSYFVRANL
jgi:hypothetical protein